MSFKLKSRINEHLKSKSSAIFSFDHGTLSAASIWQASRAWVKHLNKLGLHAGDRIVLSLDESAAFIAVILACISEKYTLCILPPSEDVEKNVQFFDARLSISNKSISSFNLSSTDLVNPENLTLSLRETHIAPINDSLFILRSSGTSSTGRWSVLSFDGIENVLNSHLRELDFKTHEKVISVLPWHHSFGLILDLLPSLLYDVEVYRIADYGKNTTNFIKQIHELKSVRLNCVPIHLSRLFEEDPHILNFIHAGIVGGASISEKLAQKLRGSKLRVGYGQTEASPGICLGKAGEFSENGLGYPLGCNLKLDDQNQLYFSGKNAFLGYWTANGLIKNEHKYIPSGDLVHYDDNGALVFDGRIDNRIKLTNGREVDPLKLENTLLRINSKLIDVCLQTNNNQDLCLFILAESSITTLEQIELESTFGSLVKLVKHQVYLTPTEWKTTPKGDKNRRLFIELIPT